MTKQIQRIACCVLLSAAWQSPGLAQAGFLSHLTVSSDYILRGLTRTVNDPTARITLEYSGESFFAGGWLSSVDYPGIGPREPFSADFDLVLFAGAFGEFNDNIGWQVQAVNHRFDGSDTNFDGTYQELSFSLDFRRRFNLSVIFTDGEHITDESAEYVELSSSRSLPRELELSGTFGYAWAEDITGSDYRYLDIGLSRAFGSFSADLRWHVTSGLTGRLQPLSRDRLVLSLSKSF